MTTIECDCAPALATTPDLSVRGGRLITGTEIRFSEIISALSVSLDITQGHPEGHSMRSALIGMRLAEELQLSTADRSALFYALLLKDLGCSSNAAKVAYLFGADDQLVKRSVRLIDWTKAGESFKHCWQNCAPGGGILEKLLKIAAMAKSGPEGAKKIVEIRCQRGANIARLLQLPEATATAILDLDEHYNGRGNPCGLKGEAISLLGRICCLAQTAEVFFTTYGLNSAIEVVQQRSGEWFDPKLVAALASFKGDSDFWGTLVSSDLAGELSRWEPEDAVMIADEDCLDRVAQAFASVVDAKSPWTYQHSTRVAEIAVGVAQEFNCPPELLRDLRRAALLHDVGKLGVSNMILDKPGKLTPEEFDQLRTHPDYSLRILQQIDAFKTLADIAAAHHERLDGRGYHRRLDGSQLPWIARVLTIADICEAMSAKRPYRDAMPWSQIEDIMTGDAGLGVDPECLAALSRWHDKNALGSRVDAQLEAMDRLLSEI